MIIICSLSFFLVSLSFQSVLQLHTPPSSLDESLSSFHVHFQWCPVLQNENCCPHHPPSIFFNVCFFFSHTIMQLNLFGLEIWVWVCVHMPVPACVCVCVHIWASLLTRGLIAITGNTCVDTQMSIHACTNKWLILQAAHYESINQKKITK